jgi:hypothetical protein
MAVIYHYAVTNLSLTCGSFNFYTDLEAAYLHRSRNRVSLIEAIARGIRCFLYHYFFAGLWRYGNRGLLLAIILGYTKFYELRQIVRTDPHPERVWNLDRAGPAVVRPVSRGRSNPLSVKGLFRRHDGGRQSLVRCVVVDAHPVVSRRGFSYVRCSHCRAVYVSPMPLAEEVARIYQDP